MSACTSFGDRETRLLDMYVEILDSDPDPSVRRNVAERLLALSETAPDVGTLETVAAIANERGDVEVQRRALELLTNAGDADTRARAFERLGDLFLQLGDRGAAIESWKPAAQMRESTPAEHDRATRLYERVLETRPDDCESAEQLVRLYAENDDWEKVPAVVGVVIRADADLGAELVLRLEGSACMAGALDTFVAMVDEAAALRSPSSSTTPRLRRARARALSGSPERHDEASATYKSLLETFGCEDDRREYQSFIGSLRSVGERREERRWLYRWRSEHEGQPSAVFLEWAKDEEEQGDLEEAVAVYRRALHAVDETARPAVAIKVASLLEELGCWAEALPHLAPLVATLPEARDAARRLLADPGSGGAVAEQLETMARESDETMAGHLLAFLLESHAETAGLVGGRRRWLRSAIALSHPTPVLSLPTLLRAALEMPREAAAWETAERMARASGRLGMVAEAYGRALSSDDVDASLAEALGRRMIALEEECSVDALFFVGALERVLEFVPGARWALDRVKLALGAQGRWDALFDLYDRAIAVEEDDDRRAELCDEAAFAARDVAGDTARAMAYLEAVHQRRPRDERVATALERLYERHDRKHQLLDLLRERGGYDQGRARRIAALELALGYPDDASETIEAMLANGVNVADVEDLLEAVASCPGQMAAASLLGAHYENSARIDDAVRIAEATLDLATEDRQRARCIREVVRLQMRAARIGSGRAMSAIETTVRRHPRLAKLAYRAALRQALVARKQAATDTEFDAALDATWCAIEALKTLVLEVFDVQAACTLLERALHLPFDRMRQRALLHQIVLLYSERAEHRRKVIGLLFTIFQEDDSDPIAAALLGRFASALEAAGEHRHLANLWETQGHHRVASGDEAEAQACYQRAATIWERRRDWDRAIEVHQRSAATGSVDAVEALARIHVMQGDWSKAATQLDWLACHSDGKERIPCLVRLAEVYVELDQRDRARACLQDVLAARPEHDIATGARTQLIALCRRDGLWEQLLDLLCVQAGASANGDERAALYRDASAVAGTKLAAPSRACELLERAVAASPHDLGLRPLLAEGLEALEEWERVADVLIDQLALYGARRSRDCALVHHRLACVLHRLGRRADARAELELAAKMAPTHPVILRDLAQSALGAGDLDLAERTYRALLLAVRHPEESCELPSPVPIFLDLGTIALSRGDTERAANLLESGLDEAFERDEDPRPFEASLRCVERWDLVRQVVQWRIERAQDERARLEALRDLAHLWRDHLHHGAQLGARLRREADSIARALVSEGCIDGARWTALWSIYGALGDEAGLFAGAASPQLLPLLEGAIASASTPDVLGALAAQLEALHSDRLADCIERWMALDPEAGQALAPRLIRLREDQGDDVGTVRALELALDAEPSNREFLQRLVTHYEEAWDWEAVAQVLHRALGAAPDDRDLLCRLVEAHRAMGDERELVHAMELSRSAHSESVEAALGVAVVYMELGRPSDALPSLYDVVESNRGRRSPLLARAYLEMAKAHLELDELAEAFDALKAGFGMDLRNGELAMLLGLVALDLGDTTTAERALMSVVMLVPRSVDPDSEAAASRAKAFHLLASMAYTDGNTLKARRWADKARSEDPSHAGALELLGRLGPPTLARWASSVR